MEKFGEYILLRKVGIGGMAELFKAKKVGIAGFERVLAIKRILPNLSSDEEFIAMFIAEAKLAARLSHKNVAQIYDFGKAGNDYFIAMEYIAGKDLRSILKRCRTGGIAFPAPLALYIGKEVASALNCAHNQKDDYGKSLNIIHRDVSPQNVLISYSGEVKVVDFGIAKAEAQSKTSTGVLKGKVSYMSPEQAWGKLIDHRSDIFSLGTVLYEMLTGEKPFKGETQLETLEKVRGAAVEILPSSVNGAVLPEIEAKLLKALAKDAKDRYQNASDLEIDLGRSLFEISNSDHSALLKQFMHQLFQAEIDEDEQTDVEEQTLVEYGDEHWQLDRSGSKPKKMGERSRFSGLHRFLGNSRNTVPYVIAGSLLIVLLVGVYFFLDMDFFRSPTPGTAVKLDQKQERAPSLPKGSITSPVAATVPDAAPGSSSSSTLSPTHKTGGADVFPKLVTGAAPTKAVPSQESLLAPSKGVLTVDAKPWADVSVKGRNYGRTPQTINDLDVGTHTVRLDNPDYAPVEKRAKVTAKGSVKVFHEFGGSGRLMINAKPWAHVYLDGDLKGQTPVSFDVSPGEHVVRIAREGFVEKNETIRVRAREEKGMSVSLEKKDVP